MPVFEHVSTYPHTREVVFAWHERPGAFIRLTPPGALALTAGPSDGINVGSELTFRLLAPLAGMLPEVSLPRRGRGPIGVPWVARHTELVPGERFVDEQVSGPLRSWRHQHLFSDAPGGGTTILDRVTWEPPAPLGPALRPVNRRLAAFFAFREAQLRDDLDFHARLAATPAHIVVSGASGLIGTQLCALLTTGGHRVTRLVRRNASAADEAFWDPSEGRIDQAALAGADAVAHLAGASIAGRFTNRHIDTILRSRVEGTSLIAAALTSSGGPRTLVQASGIGVYGARRPGEVLTEDSAAGTGVLADVVEAWESAAAPAVAAGVRTAFLRTGIVLSNGGGALPPQLPLFFAGLGGRLTAPDAWLSWIGLDDMVRAYAHALFTPTLEGPVNAVAPAPVTARQFARTLGRVMRRPAIVATPSFGPSLVLGAEGADQLIATDQHVSCERLLASGFTFAQPTLDAALRHALAR